MGEIPPTIEVIRAAKIQEEQAPHYRTGRKRSATA